MATIDDIKKIPYSGDLRVDSLLSSSLDWNYLTPTRTTLYYTFTLSLPVKAQADGLTASFNASQQAAVRSILQHVSDVTGVRFLGLFVVFIRWTSGLLKQAPGHWHRGTMAYPGC